MAVRLEAVWSVSPQTHLMKWNDAVHGQLTRVAGEACLYSSLFEQSQGLQCLQVKAKESSSLKK